MNLHFVNSMEAWVYFTYGQKTGAFNIDGKVIHDYIEVSAATNGEREHGKHPTQKLVALMEFFVQPLSKEWLSKGFRVHVAPVAGS